MLQQNMLQMADVGGGDDERMRKMMMIIYFKVKY